MIKMLILLALIFMVVYLVYCWFAYIATRSDEEQVTFYETFLSRLVTLAICFSITAGIISFIVINF